MRKEQIRVIRFHSGNSAVQYVAAGESKPASANPGHPGIPEEPFGTSAAYMDVENRTTAHRPRGVSERKACG